MTELIAQSEEVEIAASLAGDLTVPSERMAEFRSANVARLDDYFGAWCIEPIRGLAMMEHVGRMDVSAHVSNYRHEPKNYISTFVRDCNSNEVFEAESRDRVVASVDAGGSAVAVIDVCGTLMKAGSSLGSASSTVELRSAIRAAANDPKIGAILLKFDTPGGTVSGTSDFADAISYAVSRKPTWGLAEDLCASAGVWACSQCTRVYAASNTTMYGSIGTVIGLYDYSGMMGQKGVKAKVYATGPLKGAGFAGAEITSVQDAYFQDIVDSTQEHFRQAVSTGRKLAMSHVRSLETGGLFTASEAVRHSLIDGIQSFDKTLSMLFSEIKSTSSSAKASPSEQGKPTMAELVKVPAQAEVIQEVAAAPVFDRAAFMGELNAFTARFGVENGTRWFGDNISMADATGRHCEVLTAKLAAQSEEFQAALTAKDAEIADLTARLSQIKIGDSQGVSFADAEKPKAANDESEAERPRSRLASGIAADLAKLNS